MTEKELNSNTNIINTNATDICNVIDNLTDGTHTIKVSGTIHYETMIFIKKALQKIANPEIKINLDFSEAVSSPQLGPNGTFKDCHCLTSVIIPEGTIYLGQYAFYGCKNLKYIELPDSVTKIGTEAFQSCHEKLIINTTATNVGAVFANLLIGTYTIKVRGTINNYTLSVITSNNVKVNLDLSETTGLTSINEYTFDGAINNDTFNNNKFKGIKYCFTDITIPNSVISIGDKAFYGCTTLASVTIPDSVTTIGKNAFYDCDSLTSITIGNGVTTIGNYAFGGCTALTSVTIGNSVTSIGDKAFYGCSALASVTIGDSVTSIGYEAFYGCSNVETIVVGNGITSLDCLPLRKSTLKSITIGNGITSIGDRAFRDCERLTSVTIPDSVTSIGNYAFEGCTTLASVTIPDSVTTIGYEAFKGCRNLTSVTIPDSVTSIGSEAFGGCWSLTSVNYKGSQEQWKKISIGWNNESLTKATINYNYTE